MMFPLFALQVTRFHAVKAPDISIRDYLERWGARDQPLHHDASIYIK